VTRRAKSAVNDFFFGDGLFPANPPVAEGDFAGSWIRLDGFTGRARWGLTVEGLRGRRDEGARAFGFIRQPLFGRRGIVLRANGGIGTKPTMPQLAFRAGGQGTVRGFDYGTQRGAAFWTIQTDWSPFRGQVRPVFFVDAGQAGPLNDLRRQPAMVGGGIGVSALSGLVRLDFSRRLTDHPSLRSGGGFRADLVFGAVR
jgi:hypothetical protein